jgi:hypothetical protein
MVTGHTKSPESVTQNHHPSDKESPHQRRQRIAGSDKESPHQRQQRIASSDKESPHQWQQTIASNLENKELQAIWKNVHSQSKGKMVKPMPFS